MLTGGLTEQGDAFLIAVGTALLISALYPLIGGWGFLAFPIVFIGAVLARLDSFGGVGKPGGRAVPLFVRSATSAAYARHRVRPDSTKEAMRAEQTRRNARRPGWWLP